MNQAFADSTNIPGPAAMSQAPRRKAGAEGSKHSPVVSGGDKCWEGMRPGEAREGWGRVVEAGLQTK